MKASQVQIGKVYMAKVSGRIVPIRVLRKEERYSFGSWRNVFVCRNERTKREVIVKSAQRFRAPVVEVAPVPAGNAPWKGWTGPMAINRETGEQYIGTGSREWTHRLDIWKREVKNWSRVADCPCPSPIPLGHIMFEGKCETIQPVVAS